MSVGLKMEPPLYLKKNFVFKELLTKKKEHPWSCHRMTGAKKRPTLARLPDLLAGTNSRPGLGLWENPRSYESLRRACLSIQLPTSLSRRPSPGFFHSVGASRARSGGRCISIVLALARGSGVSTFAGEAPGPARTGEAAGFFDGHTARECRESRALYPRSG